jgi:hypothetical protein
MKYLLLSCLLFTSLNAYPQECTETLLLQKPGVWKEGMKGSVSGIPAADLDKEKKVVTSLHNLIKSKYTPMGVEADFTGSYDRPDPDMPVNNYDYNVLLLNYFCEGNIIKTSHETSTTFTISINRFDGKIYETQDQNNTSGEGFYFLKNMPVDKDGCYYFEENANIGFGMSGKSRSWLVTYDGKLPYFYVSKKEFLEKQKLMLSKASKDASAADQQNYKKAMAKIDNLLTMSSADLSQPAIVRQDPKDYLSYLFTSDDDPFGKVLIKPNPGYFNVRLSRAVPQFFVVNLTGDEKEAIASKVMTDIMKNFDFDALRNMLGK